MKRHSLSLSTSQNQRENHLSGNSLGKAVPGRCDQGPRTESRWCSQFSGTTVASSAQILLEKVFVSTPPTTVTWWRHIDAIAVKWEDVHSGCCRTMLQSTKVVKQWQSSREVVLSSLIILPTVPISHQATSTSSATLSGICEDNSSKKQMDWGRTWSPSLANSAKFPSKVLFWK